jgi:hypothetical protein
MIFQVGNPFVGALDWMATPGGVGPLHYPMDLDSSERHARPATGWTLWPYPDVRQRTSPQPGMAAPSMLVNPMTNAILPLFDLATYAMMVAKSTFGPGIGNRQTGSQSLMRFPNISYPGLPKDTETSPGKIQYS